MKILLFGSSGMLGSAIKQEAVRLGHEVVAPTHLAYSITNNGTQNLGNRDFEVVINAAGTISSPTNDYSANSIGALNVARLAKIFKAKFIHVSTDCVFSGQMGPWHNIYDIPDPIDMYGVSKRYGEIAVLETYPEATVVRTSFIGPRHGLLHWFLDQPENAIVQGYNNVYWSGSTVYEVAQALLQDVPPLIPGGIEHLATEQPVTKYEVLLEFKKHFRPDVTVQRVSEPAIQRALKPTIVIDDIHATMKDLVKRVK